MQLERVPVNPTEPLAPGRYFVYVDAPVAVLDGMAKMPNVGRTLVSLMFDVSGADVVYLGSGTTWTREDGELRRVFSVAFEVPDTPAVRVYYATAVPWWFWAGILGVVAGGVSVTVYHLVQKIDDLPTEDVPGVVEDVRDTARAASSAVGWLVFGGLAVGGYLIARREGWLS